MGPPKKRPKKPRIDVIRKQQNTFEYRWNKESKSYFLFNPYTGETIFNTDVSTLDRAVSMWAAPDKYPSSNAENLELYPEFFCSRRWGRRRFHGWENEIEAANHIVTVARGFLVRQWLRRYYKNRYYLSVCQFSGYYYFSDTENPEAETSWYKPRLAVPGDILVYKEEDPNDYLKGTRYSKMDFRRGPYHQVGGLSKTQKASAEHEAFHVSNPWRDVAISSYHDIDLEQAPLNSIISWLEGSKSECLQITEFHLMRTAICKGDWNKVLYYMNEMPDNPLIQMFGYQCFAKSDVPLDVSGLLDYSSNDALEKCVEILRDKEKKYSSALKIFAASAFYNILSVRPGRLEYLNTNLVPEQGELRNAAIEAFLKDRISVLKPFLQFIACESYDLYEKGGKDPIHMERPLQRSVDMIEMVIKCLCVLAHESETKEQLAFLMVEPVLHAMEICREEAYVTLHGLQFFYNLCYRCESGQEAILVLCNPAEFLEKIIHVHSGDPDVMRQCRRVELALKHNGWRGHIETLITREMKGEKLEEEHLQRAVLQKKY